MLINGVVVTVQEVARSRGFKSARALERATGINRNGCTDLWAGRSTRIDLRTLAILCKVLQCQPGELLALSSAVVVEFDPRESESSGESDALAEEDDRALLLAA